MSNKNQRITKFKSAVFCGVQVIAKLLHAVSKLALAGLVPSFTPAKYKLVRLCVQPRQASG